MRRMVNEAECAETCSGGVPTRRRDHVRSGTGTAPVVSRATVSLCSAVTRRTDLLETAKPLAGAQFSWQECDITAAVTISTSGRLIIKWP